jgi:hypothetical protein
LRKAAETQQVISAPVTYASLVAWEQAGAELAATRSSNQWAIARWMASGEDQWGEKVTYKAASRITSLSVGTLYQYAHTARHVLTQVKNLSFSHHRAVSGLSAEEQVKWLQRAERNGWPLKELKARLRAPMKPPAEKPPTEKLPAKFNKPVQLPLSWDVSCDLNTLARARGTRAADLAAQIVRDYVEARAEEIKDILEQNAKAFRKAQEERYKKWMVYRAEKLIPLVQAKKLSGAWDSQLRARIERIIKYFLPRSAASFVKDFDDVYGGEGRRFPLHWALAQTESKVTQLPATESRPAEQFTQTIELFPGLAALKPGYPPDDLVAWGKPVGEDGQVSPLYPPSYSHPTVVTLHETQSGEEFKCNAYKCDEPIKPGDKYYEYKTGSGPNRRHVKHVSATQAARLEAALKTDSK